MRALITIEDKPTAEDPEAVSIMITTSEKVTTKTKTGQLMTEIEALLTRLQNEHT